MQQFRHWLFWIINSVHIPFLTGIEVSQVCGCFAAPTWTSFLLNPRHTLHLCRLQYFMWLREGAGPSPPHPVPERCLPAHTQSCRWTAETSDNPTSLKGFSFATLPACLWKSNSQMWHKNPLHTTLQQQTTAGMSAAPSSELLHRASEHRPNTRAMERYVLQNWIILQPLSDLFNHIQISPGFLWRGCCWCSAEGPRVETQDQLFSLEDSLNDWLLSLQW